MSNILIKQRAWFAFKAPPTRIQSVDGYGFNVIAAVKKANLLKCQKSGKI